MTEIGIILLAAGSSSRMGQSKQLLKIGDGPLLVNITTLAIQSGMQTVVVLGANEKEHRSAIEHLAVDLNVNPDWKNGMGSSLKAGLNYFLQHAPNTEAIIVMVCDQPLVTAGHLKQIKEKYHESGKQIVASYYSGSAGVPALFHKTLFSEIMALSDDQGAKRIIQRHPDLTITIDFPEGSVDLDTPDDFKNFMR